MQIKNTSFILFDFKAILNMKQTVYNQTAELLWGVLNPTRVRLVIWSTLVNTESLRSGEPFGVIQRAIVTLVLLLFFFEGFGEESDSTNKWLLVDGKGFLSRGDLLPHSVPIIIVWSCIVPYILPVSHRRIQ